jgi:hypothetical protein
MNSQIAVRPANGRLATQDDIDQLIAQLPKWLAYLVGAFPAAQTNRMTFLAYETAFAEVEPSLLLTAVQTVAKTHKYATFPTIAEISQAVSVINQRAEFDTASERGVRMRLLGLRNFRHALLQRAYRGELERPLWESLISQYEAIGYEFNADWARRKLNQFEATEAHAVV